MAGFLFSLDNEESIVACINKVIYSTILSEPINVWGMHLEGTFVDSNYLVVEIKKGLIVTHNLLQLMKYLDWVKSEYAYGDYSKIKAFIVGFGYIDDALLNFKQISGRKFIH